MVNRSHKLSEQGIQRLSGELLRSGQSKSALASQSGVARDTVRKFFAGQPVSTESFIKICKVLKVDWQEVTTLAKALDTEVKDNGHIELAVQEVREKVKPLILERCGTMQVLDMSKPVPLKDIYVDVGIYESISGRRRIGIDELLEEYKNSERLTTRKSEPQVYGLEAAKKNLKQVVLGRPGCGKTMYLKFLSIQCINGNFKDKLVPIFVTLRQFAEVRNQLDLLEFICQMMSSYEVTNTQIYELLKHGSCLILLDGLDEVREQDYHRVINEIQFFLDRFTTNQFIITCRIAALKYTFDNFAELEIANFDNLQIKSFVKQWFKMRTDTEKADNFLDKLRSNRNKLINEIAANPLTLTLLCLLFEYSGAFPVQSKFELYKQIMDAVLIRWDTSRNIERDEIYKNFGLTRKRDLLSYIAYETFNQDRIFFEHRLVENYISNYIENLPDAESDPEDLETSSEKILKSIEAQHGILVEQARGIYSFSHIAFQEYFTARHIVYTPDPDEYKKIAKYFVSHITDERWQEVFIIAVGLAKSGAYLLRLIKEEVDKLVAKDEKIQERLRWVKEQSDSIDLSQISKGKNKRVAVRAFFLDIDLEISIERELGYELDLKYTCIFSFAIILTRILGRKKFDIAYTIKLAQETLHKSEVFYHYRDLDPPIILTISRVYAIKSLLEYDNIDSDKREKFEKLREEAPDLNANEHTLTEWWKLYGEGWNNRLKCVLMSHNCHYDKDWTFSKNQEALLKKYYCANLLLAECLKNSYLAPNERKEIENTMLLPWTEIEQQTKEKSGII